MSDEAARPTRARRAGQYRPITRVFTTAPCPPRAGKRSAAACSRRPMMVLQTNELFVVDFLSMGSQPQQVVSRIVMTASSFSQFLAALRQNVTHYESEIGPLKPGWTPPSPTGSPATVGGARLCPPKAPAPERRKPASRRSRRNRGTAQPTTR